MAWRLTRAAETDLIEIFIHGVASFGVEQAERYHDLLAHCFDFLAENPEAARERDEISPPVRIHPIRSHLVIYRLQAGGDIEIIRVRHAHEDWLTDGI
ncbi:MAG: plasmid stabilization protein ParE [Gammaproteobacteria bacterium HGW-Gammaproteobacteria-8]|nr:MAG: plasmid stabilization protein ParE [Gammaproteobacteria bacterium HGW-Gammaproteobacteria-8]